MNKQERLDISQFLSPQICTIWPLVLFACLGPKATSWRWLRKLAGILSEHQAYPDGLVTEYR